MKRQPALDRNLRHQYPYPQAFDNFLFPGEGGIDVSGCYWGGAFDAMGGVGGICLEVTSRAGSHQDTRLFFATWLEKKGPS